MHAVHEVVKAVDADLLGNRTAPIQEDAARVSEVEGRARRPVYRGVVTAPSDDGLVPVPVRVMLPADPVLGLPEQALAGPSPFSDVEGRPPAVRCRRRLATPPGTARNSPDAVKCRGPGHLAIRCWACGRYR
jgi:hypothetical protein